MIMAETRKQHEMIEYFYHYPISSDKFSYLTEEEVTVRTYKIFHIFSAFYQSLLVMKLTNEITKERKCTILKV